MTPMHFHGQNFVYEAPVDYDHSKGECGALPVMRHERGIMSVWKPSAEELVMLNAGGGITVDLSVGRQPVMGIGVCAAECMLVTAG